MSPALRIVDHGLNVVCELRRVGKEAAAAIWELQRELQVDHGKIEQDQVCEIFDPSSYSKLSSLNLQGSSIRGIWFWRGRLSSGWDE